MIGDGRDEALMPPVAIQNADSIQPEGPRGEPQIPHTKDALETKTRELANSLAILNATLESAIDAILVTNGTGQVLVCNQKFVDMWRIPRQVVDSPNYQQVFEVISRQSNNPAVTHGRIEEIWRTSPRDSYDVLELQDDRVIELFSKSQFVGDRDIGRVWSARDITERNRLEKSRFHLAAIVDSSDDAIISKTLNGIVTSWNIGAEHMFGYTAEEMIGKSIATLIPPNHVDEEPAILKRLRAGERINHYETVRMRKDGTLLNVSLTVSPVRDAEGRIIGASKIARDITELKRAIEEREYFLKAERAARSETERISLMKDEFLANVSHELRTPLNAILGWAQLLASTPPSDEDFSEGLATIERNARLQAQLIEDLLDMSRIVSGKVRLDVQEVDLAAVVESAVASVRPSANAKEIRLRAILDPLAGPISGDPNRLQQIVWNLLSNAIKFTPRNGTVEARLQRVNSHLELSVNDTGIGIKTEFLPYVFERFRQADASTTRKFGGLGLGLSIVKQLVELHGGSVTARSAGEGQGATFVISLPLAPIQTSRARAHPASPQAAASELLGISLEGIRVLVIDDEADACQLIKRVLAGYHADVITASGARQGVEALKSLKPHVIVCDIGMPEMDGYQFIREVRSMPASIGGRTPALALTAFARSEDRTRAIIAGYQVHVPKPIEPQELVVTIASLAGERMNAPN
jgi:PAS domain S-box-containing protein